MRNTNKKIITFDIWDTILKRKCTPEEIKLFTCQYIFYNYKQYLKEEYDNIYKIYKVRNSLENKICQKNQDDGHDYEFLINDLFVMLKEIIFNQEIKDIEKKLLELELEHEIDMTYVNPEFLELMDIYNGEIKFCISDFYMTSNDLSKILKHHNVLKYFKKIYSSADFLLTKRSGNLFKFFLDKENIDPKDMIHIGDNKISDIKIPNELGIETRHIINKNIYPSVLNRILNLSDIFGTKRADSLYEIGKSLAVIPYYFVLKIMTDANNMNIKDVYYFTREGEFFIKIHDIINSQSNYISNKVNGNLLEVSRMATFSPSLKEFSINELMNIWGQYSDQSIKDLYASLNVNLDNFFSYFEKYDIDINEKFECIWKNRKINKLFKDEEYIKSMEEEIAKKKIELKKYFSLKNIKEDSKPLFVVDIGWRGTIQDNIAKIYKEKQITGYYLALLEFINKQPANVKKLSAVNDSNFVKNCVGGLITFLEMLFIPETGSVTHYNEGKAYRKHVSGEFDSIKKYVNELQKGMLDGTKELTEFFNVHPYDINEIYEEFKKTLLNTRKKPAKKLVDAYFNIKLNDTFGANKYVDKNIKLTMKDKMNLSKCINLLRKESWKEAFLIYNRLYLLRLLLSIKQMVKK